MKAVKFFVALTLVAAAVGAAMADQKQQIYGWAEKIYIPSADLHLAAKLDTGAKTSSINARVLKLYKKDGTEMVRFYIREGAGKKMVYDKPLIRMSKIKNRKGEMDDDDEDRRYSNRPVVDLDICLNGNRKTIHVNLANRSSFVYPLLLGRAALRQFGAVVNPGKKFIQSSPKQDVLCD